MSFLPVRLPPGVDLRRTLDDFAAEQLSALAFVVAGIGSLVEARLRYAGEAAETRIEGPLEILSLSGTLSARGSHLHMAVSDAAGRGVRRPCRPRQRGPDHRGGAAGPAAGLVAIDPAANADNGTEAFGPFSWKRVKPL